MTTAIKTLRRKFAHSMSTLEIIHQYKAFDWPLPSHFRPHTLVLGSFNPYNPSDSQYHVDHFYGRRGNLLWPAISRALNLPLDYFQNDPEKKFAIMRGVFAFADVIRAITISGSKSDVRNFADQHVFSGFSDADIWKSTGKSPQGTVRISRQYNSLIPQFLETSPTVKTVVHTMGKNTISSRGVYPVEKNCELGFRDFINGIRQICERRRIEFIVDCPAPSGRSAAAWGSRKGYLDHLASFYQDHVLST